MTGLGEYVGTSSVTTEPNGAEDAASSVAFLIPASLAFVACDMLVVEKLLDRLPASARFARVTLSKRRSMSAAFLPRVLNPRSPSSSCSCLTVRFSYFARSLDSRTAETRLLAGDAGTAGAL